MLDPWIIEEIRRREQEERQHRDQPVLEVPRDRERPARGPEPMSYGDGEVYPRKDRGVVILDFQI